MFRALWLIGLSLAWAAPLGVLRAQEPPSTEPASQPATAPAAPPTVEPPTPAVQIAQVTARIQQIESATELDEALKARLLETLRQARDQLTMAETWSVKAQEFVRTRQEAPAQLQKLRESLAQPTSQPADEFPPELTLAGLEQRLAQAEADFATRKQTAAKLDDEATRREERRTELARLQSDAIAAVEKLDKELATPPAAETPPDLTSARRMALRARKEALERELEAYQEEQRSHDLTGELLTARRDLARRDLGLAERRAAELRRMVEARRRAETERQAEAAEATLRAVEQDHPVIRLLAEQNKKLTDERAALTRTREQVGRTLQDVQDLLKVVQKDESFVKESVRAIGISDDIGQLLRQKRGELPDAGALERAIRARSVELGQTIVRRKELEDTRDDLVDVEPLVQRYVRQLAPGFDPFALGRMEGVILELLQTRTGLVQSLFTDYDKHVTELYDLNREQQRLFEKATQIVAFIDEHIFWVRSTVPLTQARWPEALGQIAPVGRTLARDALADLYIHPTPYVALSLFILTHLTLQRRARFGLREIAQQVSRAETDRFRLTLLALLYSLFLALLGPAVLYFLGWRCLQLDSELQLAEALGVALRRMSSVYFALGMLLHLCRPSGVGDAHFRWRPDSLAVLRRNLRWFLLLVLPAALVMNAAEALRDEQWKELVGRGFYILASLMLATFLQRVLRPDGGVFENWLRKNSGGWLYNLRYVWYWSLVALPLAGIVAAVLGYYYTALQLERRVMTTGYIAVAVLVLHALAVRWLAVAQRRLALEQLRRKREAAREAGAGGGDAPPLDEPGVDLLAISTQTRQLLRSLAAAALVVGVWAIWQDMLPALRFLSKIELWSHAVPGAAGGAAASQVIITLADLMLATLFVVVTFVLGKNLPGLLEITLLQRLPVDPAGRYAITAVSRYIISVIGIVIAFGTVGIGWTDVQWLAAAITVGLGFGLQEIFANFVSGLIILFERPVRVGDTVTVGNMSGTVTRIRIRATTITDWDRKELIIPNRELITGQVLNWTLSDPTLRVVIPVGVAYGSDVELIKRLLVQLAQRNPRILSEPRPAALFVGFGESALNFELRAFVASIDDTLVTRDELNTAIEAAFRTHGIEIPYPQRTVRVVSDATDPAAREADARRALGAEVRARGGT